MVEELEERSDAQAVEGGGVEEVEKEELVAKV